MVEGAGDFTLVSSCDQRWHAVLPPGHVDHSILLGQHLFPLAAVWRCLDHAATFVLILTRIRCRALPLIGQSGTKGVCVHDVHANRFCPALASLRADNVVLPESGGRLLASPLRVVAPIGDHSWILTAVDLGGIGRPRFHHAHIFLLLPSSEVLPLELGLDLGELGCLPGPSARVPGDLSLFPGLRAGIFLEAGDQLLLYIRPSSVGSCWLLIHL